MNLKNLKNVFDFKDIEWRVGATNADKTKGIALAYVTNRAIQDRLDEVCGPENWKNEFVAWKDKAQLCGISIVVNKLQWVTKWDGAEDSDFEATKGGLSGAMKRAGVQWGIGRYLYNMTDNWVAIEARGKSVVIKKEEFEKLKVAYEKLIENTQQEDFQMMEKELEKVKTEEEMNSWAQRVREINFALEYKTIFRAKMEEKKKVLNEKSAK